MKRARLGDVVRVDGVICEVVAIGEGRTVMVREVGTPVCPTCGRTPDRHYLEHAPNFQTDVLPVVTIEAT